VGSITFSYGNHDEHISCHRDDIDDQKHSKCDFLHLWILGKPQENKLCHVVPILHLLHEKVIILSEKINTNLNLMYCWTVKSNESLSFVKLFFEMEKTVFNS
jgi:hypothetical protein